MCYGRYVSSEGGFLCINGGVSRNLIQHSLYFVSEIYFGYVFACFHVLVSLVLFWFDLDACYFAAFRIKLNCDQEEIVKFAAEGHNLLITGQSGAGKSEVYDRGVASTVHSFYGLLTAKLPWRQVIDRSMGNSVVCDHVKAIDLILWDEASMSSQRMFELVNVLHRASLASQREVLQSRM